MSLPARGQKPVGFAREAYHDYINRFLEAQDGLQRFYEGSKLESVVDHAKGMGDKLVNRHCSSELALWLSLLSLYDIVMLLGEIGVGGVVVCVAVADVWVQMTVLQWTLRKAGSGK